MVENPDEIEVYSVLTCDGCGASIEDETPVKVERRQVHVPGLKFGLPNTAQSTSTARTVGGSTGQNFRQMCSFPSSMLVNAEIHPQCLEVPATFGI
jgi:hypothetical protein